MLKACVKLLATGIIMIFVGVIGLGVLIGTNMIDPDDLTVNFGSSSTSSYAYEETIDTGYDGYNYVTIDSKDAEITSLDIDIGMGLFLLSDGDEFAISTEGIRKENFSYEITDGCLYLKYSPQISLISFNFSEFDNGSTIILTVPKKDFDKISVNMTAGDVSVMNVNTKKLTAKSSAGDMFIDSVYAESASFKMTAGECNVSNSTIKNVSLSMTAGEMYFNDCKLYGDNNIKMTAGHLQMCLIGDRADYRINVDKALGDVYINGTDMGEFAETTFATTMILTQETVTQTEISEKVDENGEKVLVEQEDEDKNSNNEKPNGSIDINMTAGDCYIDFLGGNDYE
ncbi:MAG: DUF4097 domain-containing protein [Oscillospiraceae bacterium]|nr:DUF4097 domain-containing protein [Oscillospiraceae bacterium]